MMQHFGEGFIHEGSAREKGTTAETRLTAWWFVSAFSTKAYSKEEEEDEKTQEGVREHSQIVFFLLQTPKALTEYFPAESCLQPICSNGVLQDRRSSSY